MNMIGFRLIKSIALGFLMTFEHVYTNLKKYFL